MGQKENHLTAQQIKEITEGYTNLVPRVSLLCLHCR